ncbi:Transcriptional regulator, LysR family (plasmid) [Sinorhizobium sp. CCBAU 05631]|nr:Transcriptional regulator, LysR family [Sinorhizobium sp. CCBAU 05631]
MRAGRGLVLTPRALELRERVGHLVEEAEAALRPADRLDLGRLVRTFTLRTSDGFVENFGPALIAKAGAEAPGVPLRFVPKLDKDSTPLRDGSVDLETGVVGGSQSPEIRNAGLVPGSLRRHCACRTRALPGRDHARPLCRRAARARRPPP